MKLLSIEEAFKELNKKGTPLKEDLNDGEKIEVLLGNKKVIGIVNDIADIEPEDYDMIKHGQNFAQAIQQCIKEHPEQKENLNTYAQLYWDEGDIFDFNDVSAKEVYGDFLAVMETTPEDLEPDSFYATDTETETIDWR